MKTRKLLVFADGGSRGNPGPAAIGFLVKDETEKVLVRQRKRIGRATNNVAEYTAVIEALKWLSNRFSKEKALIIFFLDSQLVVNQLNGLYKIKNAALRNLIIKIRQLENKIGGDISYQHIPRVQNQEADTLVNQAFKN